MKNIILETLKNSFNQEIANKSTIEDDAIIVILMDSSVVQITTKNL